MLKATDSASAVAELVSAQKLFQGLVADYPEIPLYKLGLDQSAQLLAEIQAAVAAGKDPAQLSIELAGAPVLQEPEAPGWSPVLIQASEGR